MKYVYFASFRIEGDEIRSSIEPEGLQSDDQVQDWLSMVPYKGWYRVAVTQEEVDALEER